jgi:hypothetical protein
VDDGVRETDLQRARSHIRGDRPQGRGGDTDKRVSKLVQQCSIAVVPWLLPVFAHRLGLPTKFDSCYNPPPTAALIRNHILPPSIV